MKALIAAVIAGSALLLPVTAAAQTEETLFATVAGLFAEASHEFRIAAIPSEEIWAGKCVWHNQPDSPKPSVLDYFIFGGSDPVQPTQRYFTERTADGQHEDYYVELDESLLINLHQTRRPHIRPLWSEAQMIGDPVAGDKVTFRYEVRDAFDRIREAANFELKATTTESGQPMYLLRALCPFTHGCASGADFGEPINYCYYWEPTLIP